MATVEIVCIIVLVVYLFFVFEIVLVSHFMKQLIYNSHHSLLINQFDIEMAREGNYKTFKVMKVIVCIMHNGSNLALT